MQIEPGHRGLRSKSSPGSDLSAASGRRREGSEWQRSADDAADRQGRCRPPYQPTLLERKMSAFSNRHIDFYGIAQKGTDNFIKYSVFTAKCVE